MKCIDCGGDYKVIEDETAFSGKKFQLLECEKCKRTIIVPKEGAASATE